MFFYKLYLSFMLFYGTKIKIIFNYFKLSFRLAADKSIRNCWCCIIYFACCFFKCHCFNCYIEKENWVFGWKKNSNFLFKNNFFFVNDGRYYLFTMVFFKKICINEMINPKLQKQYMPKRYWKHLIEKSDS